MVWSGKCIGEGHTMNNKIRFAILGAGVVAGFHADAVESIENAELVGVYDPNADNASKFAEKYNLPFVLLSDTELDAIKKYDVWQEKKMCGKVGMGVVRTTYIIDEKGFIEKVMPKVKPDTNAAEILAEL